MAQVTTFKIENHFAGDGPPSSNMFIPAGSIYVDRETGNIYTFASGDWALASGGGGSLPLQVAADGDPVLKNASGETVLKVSAEGSVTLVPTAFPTVTYTGTGPWPDMTLVQVAPATIVDGANLDQWSGLGVETFGVSDGIITAESTNLNYVLDGLSLSNIDVLTALSLPALQKLFGPLSIVDMGGLETVDVSALETAIGITITDNPVLTDVLCPLWNYSRAQVNISSNASITTVDLSSFVHADSLSISNNGSLDVVSLAALDTTDAEFIIAGCPLTSLDISSLAVTLLSLTISETSLPTLDMSALQMVGDSLVIGDNPALTTVTWGTLWSIAGDVILSGNALSQVSVDATLEALVAMDGTGPTSIFENHEVNLSGGTNASPGAAGLAAKATLEGRGCTVTVN